jgi:GNAT superfamily N-acetyltransferase
LAEKKERELIKDDHWINFLRCIGFVKLGGRLFIPARLKLLKKGIDLTRMKIRVAEITDIPAMHRIRLAVRENVLTNPLAVQEADYVPYLTQKGKGWVCERAGELLGFAIVDLENKNVWALFVDPASEGQGLGSALHDGMLVWYFSQTDVPLHLGTAAGTKAELFYQKRAWEKVGIESNGDITFIMPRKPLHLSS